MAKVIDQMAERERFEPQTQSDSETLLAERERFEPLTQSDSETLLVERERFEPLTQSDSEILLAEREGFEPPVPLRVRLISSQVHSTGLCHLSACLLF